MRSVCFRAILFCLALLFGAVPVIHGQSSTWTETAVYTFPDLTNEIPSLVQAPDGNFWGVTVAKGYIQTGATNNTYGRIFKITPSGAYTDVHDFTDADGAIAPQPGAGLIVGHDGALYGFLSSGLESVPSKLYRITTDGDFSIVFTFPSTALISAPPIQDAQGNFYGQSAKGGANGTGFLFEYSAAGEFTDLYDCAADGSDCSQNTGPLVQGSDGILYGTSYVGGTNQGGSIFSYQPGTGLKVIYSCPAYGSGNCYYLYGGLTELSDGSLWGHSFNGGATSRGDLFRIVPDGKGAGTFEDIYSFTSTGFSQQPKYGALWLGGDGNLYGTATGGADWTVMGTVYQFAPSSRTFSGVWSFPGAFVTPHELFSLDSDPIQGSDGNLWAGAPRGAGGGASTDFGGIVKLTPSTPLAPAITLTASAQKIDLGKSVTLTYSVNNAYSMTAKQCDAFTNAASGDVFTGSLSTSGTATITPTKAGMYTFAYTCGGVETATVTVNVDNVPPSITTSALPNATVGSSYSATLAASGGVAPYTWSIPSGLPLGLSLDAKTGIISGKPTHAGTDNFTVQVSDSESTPATASASLAITVAYPPISITTSTLPAGQVGTAYAQTLEATGGDASYVWSISSGSLPTGLKLDASSGVLSGTPTAAGSSSFTVKITDSETTPATATANLGINIAAAPITPTITASVNPTTIAPGGSTTLTAVVSGTPAATGTVQFLSNGANLGSPVTLANGAATLSNQSFATAGTYSITALYSGDANYTAATSAAIALTVAELTPAITASPTTVTIASPGGSGSTTLTLKNFSSGSVSVTCSGLPAGATCKASDLSTSGMSTLTITTTGVSAALTLPFRNEDAKTMYALALPGLFALSGLFATRKRHWRRLLVLLLFFSAGAALVGCGGSDHTSGNTGTPAGTSTVTVTATAGSQTATVPITLVVQ